MFFEGDPRQVVCPACNAQAGHPCTAATNTSRREVKWFHYARQEALEREQEAS